MQNKLKILSLNTWHGKLKDGLLPYLESKLASVDVFCLQEADGEAFDAIEDLLLQNYDGYYADKKWGEEHFKIATYVRREHSVSLSRPILVDHAGSGLALLCTIQVGTSQISVASVHGQPAPGNKLDTPVRIAQTQELINAARVTPGPHVFIGDFNLLPNTLSVELFAQHGYKNLIEEYDIPTTRNEIAWRRYPDNKQLYADYAFVEDNELLDYDFTVEDIDVSDHLPLLLDVHVTARSDSALQDAYVTQERSS